ncbi:hypothetical protein, partial [Pseudomonas aeruginosa]|uniref:hypothetical protein n=1 Tax=Pseudomonas aeruginosa TaxID=287 RepID=UPI003983CCA3
HPVFSCSKIEQKQLNTWVSFQSAEQPLLGQFSVSGNTSLPQPARIEPARANETNPEKFRIKSFTANHIINDVRLD